MMYLWATLLVCVNAGCLALTLLMLPGNWLMIAATALVAWWQWDRGMFSPWTLAAAVVLAVAGELVELLAGAGGVRKRGGTRLGGLGALGGGIAGGLAGTALVPIPVFGTLLGVCLGAGAGAIVGELAGGRTPGQSWRSGSAAGRAAVMGVLGKFLIGALIWLVIAVAAYWP